eukprot:365581-Chlamydomonas_euryale.AAC.8
MAGIKERAGVPCLCVPCLRVSIVRAMLAGKRIGARRCEHRWWHTFHTCTDRRVRVDARTKSDGRGSGRTRRPRDVPSGIAGVVAESVSSVTAGARTNIKEAYARESSEWVSSGPAWTVVDGWAGGKELERAREGVDE